MRVLIVGSGGREHALAWKIAQSDKVTKLYALPGNAGIGQIAERVPGNVMDIKAIADFAEHERIDLTIVGPESPLIIGLSDELASRGLRVFGPSKEAAQMEGSKVFAKALMLDAGIPTAMYEVFDDPGKASTYIESVAAKSDAPIVVKADGEAAGKGVFVSKTKQDALQAVDVIMKERAFGASGNLVVVEDYLDGPEATFMCFVDGETFIAMVPSQDYKRAYDNDQGLNTGGMGCYSPVPALTCELQQQVIKTVVHPTLSALAKRGILYQGVLYVGLALTSQGPKVVEFNSRFGDPETQVVMPLLESDLVDICLAVAEGRLAQLAPSPPILSLVEGGRERVGVRGESLDSASVSWYNSKALCVVMASGGYPGDYAKGKAITGIEDAEAGGAVVFHAGTEMSGANLVTSGGRVLGVTAVGDDFQACINTAYDAVRRIQFDGAHYRTDIGTRLV